MLKTHPISARVGEKRKLCVSLLTDASKTWTLTNEHLDKLRDTVRRIQHSMIGIAKKKENKSMNRNRRYRKDSIQQEMEMGWPYSRHTG